MGKERQKRKELRQLLSPLARFWHHDGRRYCAIALCASLIAGNIGHMAVAASEDPDYKFELDRVALYEALQQAVADGNTVDSDFDFQGLDADTYAISMAADGSLYELTPEIEDNKGSLQLRVFARLGEDIELVDNLSEEIGSETSYEIDGSEEFYFLLTNTSNQEQTAVIRVGEKEAELISVIPYSDVEVPEPEGKASAYALDAAVTETQTAGPGVETTESTGETSTGTVTSGGSGSSGSGSGGGGGSSGSSIKNETAADIEISTEAATEPEIETETEVKVEETETVVPETPETEVNVPETEIPETDAEATDQVESEVPAESEDSTEIENEAPKMDVDVTIDVEDSGMDVTEETDVSVVEDDKNAEAAVDTNETNDEEISSNDTESSDDIADGNNDDAVSDTNNSDASESVDVASISLRKTYRVASSKATPSNATPSDATPSDASASDMALDTLDGTVLNAVRLGDASAVIFVTTAEELKVSNDLKKFASPSNAGRLYEADLDAGLIVQVYANEDAFDEHVELSVKELKEDDEETAEDYQAAKDALDADDIEYSGMIALDISFLNDAGDEVEPKNGSVQVYIEMDKAILPDDVIEETLAVKHLEEDKHGNIENVNTVADNADTEVANVEVDAEAAVVTAEFEVESFSTFTITWRNKNRTLNVQYSMLSEDTYTKIDLNDVRSSSVTVEDGFNISGYVPSTAIGSDDKKSYVFSKAVLNTGSGTYEYTDISDNAFYSGRGNNGYVLYYYANGHWNEVPNNSTLYLVYEVVEPLPTFPGVDTSGIINVHMVDYSQNDSSGSFVITGSGGGKNQWTGDDGGVYQGIVNPNLVSGYPTVATDNFSLQKFFTGGIDTNYLFQIDDDGYYYYDSGLNFAKLDTSTGEFALYGTKDEGIPHASGTGIPASEPQFMPYNTIVNPEKTATAGYTYYDFGETKNYYFGMAVDFEFIMPEDGQLVFTNADGSKTYQDMVFEFEGDDDLWVFIDDVLVLDMGGVHDNYAGSINFASKDVSSTNGQKVSVDKKDDTTIEAMFAAAGKTWDDSDYKTHTFKMFYMERGAGGSNCKIKFNLPAIPQGTINFQKDLVYANVADAADLDFEFKTYVNYSGEENGTYELYTGLYEIYNVSDLQTIIASGTVGSDGIIKLKDNQVARLVNDLDADEDETNTITAVSKFYVQEVGATSDKYEVTIDNVSVTQKKGDESDSFIGAETEKLVVGDNPYIVFENNVVADNQFNLKIDKEMSDGSTPTEKFQFKLLLGANESLYTGEYDVYKDDGTVVERERTATDGIISFKVGQYAQIVGLVGGNVVKVQEVNLGDEYGTPTYAISGAVKDFKVAEGEYAQGTALEGNELKAAGGLITVTVTNNPKPDLTVTKKVSGILGDRNKAFEFTIEVKDKDGTSVDVDGTYGGITIEGGKFALKHGQFVTIPNTKLPENAWCRVIETSYADDGYVTNIEISNIDPVKGTSVATIDSLSVSTVITFTNTKTGDVDTGVLLDSLPYVLILAAVIAGVAFYFIRKKKDDEDDLD